ncbi:zinc-binding protein A33-like [Mytilus trossulus]|uniref:zinc-binding protein A33-like n=1 Tax=Mytilus trossulus TaxID=6551 RepID=UPI003004C205
MATSTIIICSLCQEDNETSTAVTWCAECEVFLCSECQKHHGRSKMSKHHQVMGIHDYQNLPESMLNIKNNCEDHDLKYELFCGFHDCACCMKCIKDKHDNCKGLVSLDEVVGNIKSSAFVSEVQTDLINLHENLKTIKLFFSENLSALEKQKLEATSRVHTMRQSINNHLDKLEEILLDDIRSEFTNLQETIGNIKSEIESKTDQVEEKQKDFSKMVEFSTDLQTYFVLHEVEKVIKQEEQFINKLKSADKLREKRMKVDCFDLESTVRCTKEFGKLSIYLSPNNLQLKTKVESQLQSYFKNPVLSIVKPVLKQRFKMPKNPVHISGCQILPNSDIVFVDQEHNSLLLFNNAGVFVKEIMTFINTPSDICYVRQREIAVTLLDKRRVFIIDVDRNKVVRRTDVDGRCCGICTYEQMMYVICDANSVLVLDFDLNVENSIQIVTNSLSRIAVFGDRLYCTHSIDNSVVCYSKEGEKFWFFNDEIRFPFGIDIDKNGFVYVACKGSNNIIILSQDGTKKEVIMSEDSGVEKPLALNIDRELSIFVFSNENGESFYLST